MPDRQERKSAALGNSETIDELRDYGLRIIQPRDGYRFSLDPVILSDFVDVREGERVIDFGTGCGIVPLILARKSTGTSFVGVEFQETLVGLARRNVQLNGLQARIEIVAGDILHLRGIFPADSFDIVTANPPYRVPGTGRTSPRPGRDAARHETTAGLADFVEMGKRLVKSGGRICLVYHVSRLAELFAEAERQRLTPLRIRFVHGSEGAEARMFLLELVKGKKGEIRVLPPLFVSDDDRGKEK